MPANFGQIVDVASQTIAVDSKATGNRERFLRLLSQIEHVAYRDHEDLRNQAVVIVELEREEWSIDLDDDAKTFRRESVESDPDGDPDPSIVAGASIQADLIRSVEVSYNPGTGEPSDSWLWYELQRGFPPGHTQAFSSQPVWWEARGRRLLLNPPPYTALALRFRTQITSLSDSNASVDALSAHVSSVDEHLLSLMLSARLAVEYDKDLVGYQNDMVQKHLYELRCRANNMGPTRPSEQGGVSLEDAYYSRVARGQGRT